MSEFSLPVLLQGLHQQMESKLKVTRSAFGHGPTKGDASEGSWTELLNTYLPTRYHAVKGHVVDSAGAFSQQIDIIIYDRQYTPLIFKHEGQTVVPAESVYAVLEAKQAINLAYVRQAHEKARSVRCLHRTSVSFHSGGIVENAKPLLPIIAGIVTLQSDWSPPLGKSLNSALTESDEASVLDIGCVAAHGHFLRTQDKYVFLPGGAAVTAFVFELIAKLQAQGTVPALDVRAYARWLDPIKT